MKDAFIKTPTTLYRITCDGHVFSQPTIKIPICTKNREWSGEFIYKTLPEREVAYSINNRGYKTISMNKTTKMVHRLVAEFFCEHPQGKDFVNHKDGNKLNNHYSNLEWCTIKENKDHARKTGLWVQPKGYKIKYKSKETKDKCLANLKDNTLLTEEQVKFARKYVQRGVRNSEYSITAMAERFGVSHSTLSDAIRGKTFKHIK